jgi:hypothetical protein
MSMTQIALVKKADLPTKNDLEKAIGQLEHQIEILDDFDKFDNLDGISCKFHDTETFFELYFNSKEEILSDYSQLDENFDDYDYAVSFIWGADFAAGASIGIICIVLIDLCKAKVFYMDDDMHYTREMLLNDTPLFIQELEKQKSMNTSSKANNPDVDFKSHTRKIDKTDKKQNQSFWTKLKGFWS